jgi:hypothetical protein
MSKHHHSTTSYRISELVRQVSETEVEEWIVVFGIEQQEDGTIYDELSDRIFSSVYEWAQVTVNEDEQDLEYDDSYTKGRFDDDDY